MKQQQPRIEHLKSDVSSLRVLVEKSRSGVTSHHDLDAVEKEVINLASQWATVSSQAAERCVIFVLCLY